MRLLIVYMFFFFACPLLGQVDTLLYEELAEVLVSDTKVTEPMQGLKDDQLVGLADLGDALTKKSNHYIKSYGLGSLATMSIWGGNANQNLMTWEKIPVTNPMLGLSDLSLISMNSNKDITIMKGGSSSAAGSGAITGVVDISNKVEYGPKSLGTTIDLFSGSFGRYGGDVVLDKQGAQFSYQLNLFHKRAHNRFLYQDQKVQSNADFSLSGLTINAGYLINKNNTLRLDGWLQDSEKGIPPITTQTTSVARQEDLTKRIKLSWQHNASKLKSELYAALIDEDNNYNDPQNLIDAENRFQTLTQGAEMQSTFMNTNVTVKYDLTSVTGHSKSYEDEQQQLTIAAIYADLKQVKDNFTLQASVRKEWRDYARPPLIPQLSLSHKSNFINTKLKLSKEYRAPTLNELFWVPGGNNLLLPEEGWNQELWFSHDSKKKNFSASAIFFHRHISNWIIWAPLDGQQLWSAYNLGKVRSYGIDSELQKSMAIADWLTQIHLGASYVKSENLITNELPRIEKGDQLIYTPIWNSHLNLTTSKNRLTAATQFRYTSSARGINENIDPYFLVSMQLGYKFPIRSIENDIEINIENLLNTEYRVIERRPMPGRYYNLKWTLKINK